MEPFKFWDEDVNNFIYRLEEITGKPVESLLTEGLDDNLVRKLERIATFERELNIPLPYLTGRAYFLDLELEVGPGVFIPRPETEILALAVVRQFESEAPRRILEVGTGSGALSIYLARKFRTAAIVAVDVSRVALRYAMSNARKYGLSNIRFILSDVYESLEGHERYDLVVSNPPYIPRGELRQADPSLTWEPLIALDGGPDGLRVIRKIVSGLEHYLVPGGHLFMEIFPGISEALKNLALEFGYELEFLMDLDGKVRVAHMRRRTT